MPQALSSKPEPYQHAWTPGGEVRRDLHRLGLSAEGLHEVGRAGLPVGEALRREVRQGRGRDVVLGGLERAQHRLLARHARGVPQALRLRHRRRPARAADGARRRPRHRPGGAGGHVPARLPRARAARHELSPPARSARRSTSSPSTPRARRRFVDGHVRMGIANQLANIDEASSIIASFPELKTEADRHRRVRSRRLRRLPRGHRSIGYRNGDDVFELHGRGLRRASTTCAERTASTSRARSPGRSSSRTSPTSPASACWPRTASTLPVLNVFRMLGRWAASACRR